MVDYDNRFCIDPKFLKLCGCPSILIVDDQFINKYIIEQYCAKYKVPCSTAEDGLEAVKQVKEAAIKDWWEGFHLILMDLNMPYLGGIEATKLIIESQSRFEASQDLAIIGNIPNIKSFIAVTAFALETEKQKWLDVGMQNFIPKPFQLLDFLRLIST